VTLADAAGGVYPSLTAGGVERAVRHGSVTGRAFLPGGLEENDQASWTKRYREIAGRRSAVMSVGGDIFIAGG